MNLPFFGSFHSLAVAGFALAAVASESHPEPVVENGIGLKLIHVPDIEGLQPGATVHYSLVAITGGSTTCGEDRTCAVPADDKPLVITGVAQRISQTTAQVEGRLNPMGLCTNYHFEFGPDTNYGSRTASNYGGLQITPRQVFAALSGLKPASTIHYRLVGVNATGTSYGNNALFQTANE